MRQFADLMHLGREESAYLQAQSIREDLIAQGQPVPTSVSAGYQTALVGYNLRELTEIRRQKQENWLAVLLSVEQSAIPFPDEPPIRFPDSNYIKRVTKLRYGAAGSRFDNWADFSKYRIKRYAYEGFGSPDEVGSALEFQAKLNQKFDFELLAVPVPGGLELGPRRASDSPGHSLYVERRRPQPRHADARRHQENRNHGKD